MRGAAMSLTAAASGFVVFLLSVSVIQGQKGWGVTYTSTEICAVKGSTVEIHCSYRYPSRINSRYTRVKKTLWFTKMKESEPVDLRTDPEYSGRVQYSSTDKDCTLRITDLRDSDLAVYMFRFITNQPDRSVTGFPGVTLSVTDLEVQVRRSFFMGSDLKCLSSCLRPDHNNYVWYRNGQEIIMETSHHLSYFDPAGNYSCALRGHENFPSPSVYAPKLPSVSVSPSAEIVEGSSVTLTCSSDANPAANYTWYKWNVKFQPSSEEPQLVFSSIQSSDSGQYYCAAENELGKRRSDSIFVHVKCKSTMTISIIRLTLVVVMLIALLLFFLWMRFRKKKTLSFTSEPNEPKETPELDSVYENILDTAAQREDAEEQEDLV